MTKLATVNSFTFIISIYKALQKATLPLIKTSFLINSSYYSIQKKTPKFQTPPTIKDKKCHFLILKIVSSSPMIISFLLLEQESTMTQSFENTSFRPSILVTGNTRSINIYVKELQQPQPVVGKVQYIQ